MVARVARAQNDADPALIAPRQALRVLLGRGVAEPASGQAFWFDGKLYRGTYARTGDGEIVNLIDLEQYLYSVVAREMPSAWPAVALQTQAICARTYVLQRSDPRRDYDLVPSELDQIYDGIAGETPATVAAVNATTGTVLSFGSLFARIAYSSCCGGHTESAGEAWGNLAPPYLEGIVCTWCTASPNYRWDRTLSLVSIAQDCSTQLTMRGTLEGVKVAQRDASGRARMVELFADRGSVMVTGSAFRRAVGTRVLPSLLLTNVAPMSDRANILIQGAGLGHGVGLCQWGARGMALDGRTPVQILSWYFPGTGLANLTAYR